MQITFDPNNEQDCAIVQGLLSNPAATLIKPTTPVQVLPMQTRPSPDVQAEKQVLPGAQPGIQPADDPLPDPGNVRSPADLAPAGGTISSESFRSRIGAVIQRVAQKNAVSQCVAKLGFTKIDQIPEAKYIEVLTAVEALS